MKNRNGLVEERHTEKIASAVVEAEVVDNFQKG